MKKIINIIIIILCFLAVVILGIIAFRYYESQKNDKGERTGWSERHEGWSALFSLRSGNKIRAQTAAYGSDKKAKHVNSCWRQSAADAVQKENSGKCRA